MSGRKIENFGQEFLEKLPKSTKSFNTTEKPINSQFTILKKNSDIKFCKTYNNSTRLPVCQKSQKR